MHHGSQSVWHAFIVVGLVILQETINLGTSHPIGQKKIVDIEEVKSEIKKTWMKKEDYKEENKPSKSNSSSSIAKDSSLN